MTFTASAHQSISFTLARPLIGDADVARHGKEANIRLHLRWLRSPLIPRSCHTSQIFGETEPSHRQQSCSFYFFSPTALFKSPPVPPAGFTLHLTSPTSSFPPSFSSQAATFQLWVAGMKRKKDVCVCVWSGEVGLCSRWELLPCFLISKPLHPLAVVGGGGVGRVWEGPGGIVPILRLLLPWSREPTAEGGFDVPYPRERSRKHKQEMEG